MGLIDSIKNFFKRFGAKNSVDDKPSADSDLFGADEIIYTVEVTDLNSILTICQKDFSQPGYAAARKVPDNAYARIILDGIKGKMLNYVQKVESIYAKKLKELEDKIEALTNDGLQDLANTVQIDIERITEEVSRLNDIKIQIEEETENGAFMHVKKTFTAGFTRGLVEETFMNKIQENL